MKAAFRPYCLPSLGDIAPNEGPAPSPAVLPDSDFKSFLARMLELTADRRPRQRSPQRPPPPPGPDGRGAPTRIDLVLYTSPDSAKSMKALRAVRNVLSRYESSQVGFSTCDLSVRPEDGDADSVVFTPTLVKQGPGPRTAIIGNLENEEVLCDLLEASGVDRRRDD